MSEIRKYISKRIWILRTKSGMTQEQFEEKADIEKPKKTVVYYHFWFFIFTIIMPFSVKIKINFSEMNYKKLLFPKDIFCLNFGVQFIFNCCSITTNTANHIS